MFDWHSNKRAVIVFEPKIWTFLFDYQENWRNVQQIDMMYSSKNKNYSSSFVEIKDLSI